MWREPREPDVVQPSATEFEAAVREFGHWIDKALEFVKRFV